MPVLAILFLLLSFNINSFAVDKPVIRGERPPIDLTTVPDEAYEEGVIRIKFDENVEKTLSDTEMSRTEEGTITFGLSGLDAMNAKYHVSNAKKTFGSAALNNRYTERHKKWGFHLWYDLHVDASTDIIAMIKDYMRLPEVSFAEPHYKKELIGNVPNDEQPGSTRNDSESMDRDKGQWFPNDPDFDDQWHYHNTGQTGGLAGADISLPEAWTMETGDSEVIIAVIDGGIAIDHPDLEGNIWDGVGYNFVSDSPNILPHNHGSHVAGTIAAVTDNNIGVSGIAGGWGSIPGVSLMSAQVFEPGFFGPSGGFEVAPIYAADNGAAISQNSWGYTSAGFYEQAVLDAIDYFNINGGGDVMDGGLTIFAAGNDNNAGQNYPGYYSGAVAVAATNHNDELAWYSNYGSHIEISAPGGETNTNSIEGVLSSLNSGYDFYQGTSMACPHVSGVIALMLSMAQGDFTAEEILNMVKSTTDDIDAHNPGYIGQMGTGRLNAHQALLETLSNMADPEAPGEPTDFTVTPGAEGALSAELNWTNPDINASGEPLTELDTIKIFRDNELIDYILDPVVGENDSFTDNAIDEDGQYSYIIRGANFAGEGFAATSNAYIGHDVPAAPSNIALNAEGDNAGIAWNAPAEGLNDGFFDGSDLTYSLVRFPDETEVANNLSDTIFLDTNLPNIGNFYYEVTAHNQVGEGGSDVSNIATLGASGLLIFEPFDLETGELPTGWTVDGLGSSNWGVNNDNSAGGEAPEMRLNWSSSFEGESALLTHVVDIESYSNLHFEFKNYLNKYNTQAIEIAVEYNINNEDTWEELMAVSPIDDYGPEHEEFSIELPDHAESIQFAFRWDGNTFNIWDWNIDDVILSAMLDYYDVTFDVLDQNENPLTDAIITFNGYGYEPGHYVFTDVEPGTFHYMVEKEGYTTVEGEIVVEDDDVTETVVLEEFYTITFEPQKEDGTPLEEAVITLDEVEKEAGDYVFENLLPGSYDYTAEKEGYHTVEGNIEVVDEDLDVDVVMNLITYMITFDVIDEHDQAIDNAIITLDEQHNDPGNYIFEDLLPGFYDYIVEKEGYFTAEGDIEVEDEDAVKTIVLSVDDTSLDEIYAEEFTVYPNPANDRITIESTKTMNKIQLINLSGQVNKDITVDGTRADLHVNDIEPGGYFVRIHTKNNIITKYLQIIR